ncbi:MAG: hypothetical protein HY291_08970 [Planctomycetes bacterium]|nr:hypothetical protein [Planctomycetota bacterium]
MFGADDPAPPPLPDMQDPGTLFDVLNLGIEEEKIYRVLFEKLATQDFDARENTVQRLVTRGPAVLPLAAVYAKSKDPEIAEIAASLRGRILLKYDGFLPPDPKLLSAMDRPITMKIENKETALELLQRLAKEQNVNLLFDQRYKPADFNLPESSVLTGAKMGRAVEVIANACNLVTAVRGDVLLLTSVDDANRLDRQRHSFGWKDLGMDREEAARIGESLQAFFPGVITELHTGSEVLSVRGPVGCIPKAARIVALLKPGSSGLWPAPSYELKKVDQTLALLEKPVAVALNRDDLTYALDDFHKTGLKVAAVAGPERAEKGPYPQPFQGLAPVTISLDGVPLGLALRWLVKRAAFPGQDASTSGLYAETDALGRVQVRVGAKDRDLLGLSVGGCEAGFLRPPELPVNTEDADKAVLEKLRKELGPHLLLFPEVQIETDLRVLRGRLLMQGTPASISAAIGWIKRWEKDGKPPPCAWFEAMRDRLDAPFEWDGRGLTAGKLLRKLREQGKFPVLLDDAADGDAAHFVLKNEDAELLPPGKHTLRELFDDLAIRAGAKWEIRWGTVVLTPAPKVVKRAPPPPKPPEPAAEAAKTPATAP